MMISIELLFGKKRRVNKEGDFDGQELQITVEKINDYIHQKSEGKLEIKETKKDILTKALNSDEHGGRVRAVGGHITPTLYFNVGRSWKTEDVDRKLMIEQKKELIEARKLIQEQDTRIQKLQAIVYKKGSWDSEIDDKGSCSVKLHQVNENEMKIDKCFPSYEDLNDVEIKVVEKSVALQGQAVILTLDSSTDIVAYGTVVEVNGANNLLHGVPLPQNCMRVSIDEAMQKSALLPIPIPNECENVGDAVGTHVAWPNHLIMLRQEKRQRHKTVSFERNQTLSSNVPRAVRMVYCYCKTALENGRKLSFLLDYEVFADDYEVNLHFEDISPLYHLEPISGNCIVVYICIPNLQKNTHDKTGKTERLNKRASSLADRLSGAAMDQVVLVPSCCGFHWTLTVIEPYKEIVYLVDSLSHRIRDEDWKYVVEMALRLFNSTKGRKGRKRVQWEVIKAPKQPDANNVVIMR
ncbi:uncharacterized protein [Primulina eburnea]|uniref:uncharacterized protein n=1 Tax=Primulina eburnea TaxID=1245227 RepID=UPI003C6C0DE9